MAAYEEMSPEEKLVQIIHLYKERYISLASAKGLARKHVPDLARRVTWLAVKRE